jgi:hypothetical protein
MPARLILLINLLFTYSDGLWALLGSAAIVLVAWRAWGKEWGDRLGLRNSRPQAWLGVLAAGLAAGAARALIPPACQSQRKISPIDNWEIIL